MGSAIATGHGDCGGDCDGCDDCDNFCDICDVDISSSSTNEDLELSAEERAFLKELLETSESDAETSSDLMTLLSEELQEASAESSSFDAFHNAETLDETELDTKVWDKNSFFAAEEDEAFSLVQITAVNSASSKSVVATDSDTGAETHLHEISATSETDTESADESSAHTFSSSLLDLLDASDSASAHDENLFAKKIAKAESDLDVDASSETEEFDQSGEFGTFGPGFFRSIGGTTIGRLISSIFN